MFGFRLSDKAKDDLVFATEPRGKARGRMPGALRAIGSRCTDRLPTACVQCPPPPGTPAIATPLSAAPATA